MIGGAAVAEATVSEPLLGPGVAIGAVQPAAAMPAVPALSAATKQHWVEGTAALTTALMVERGTGLLANVLAARLGGAAVFGSYSLAISTANNVSTYAAGGIGATATRFSGKYPHSSHEYGSLARALAVVALVSAAMATAALWAGAVPLAHLLQKPGLAGLLRWASLSAAGMIVLECARGFFVGQRRVAALLLLSVLVGAGLLLALPMAARQGSAARMVLLQAGVCFAAVAVCLLLNRTLALRGKVSRRGRLCTMLREVWGFGTVQLSGMVAANLAGWWLTTLIARSDRTLVQVGFFAIASQMRNLAGVVPGLLTEGSYAVMAAPEEMDSAAQQRSQHRVMALASFASSAVGLGIACVGIVIAPWALRLLYGRTYVSAQGALAVALALAVAHMSNAPASARLTIVDIRWAGLINTAWAVCVGAAATLLLFHGGGAWQGLAILLAAHLISATLVLTSLQRKDHVPAGMRTAYYLGSLGASVLAGLALLRAWQPRYTGPLTVCMILLAAMQLLWLAALGKRHHWIPSRSALLEVRDRVFRIRQKERAHV
ncbi:lipopolysaccharide biosynthesis protein [Terriglobus aquaticus]|uniref:Lipopolysaccharide biosynthesis protein n=1 Tax=Terriglobus aquaticus TaxID=940139 RepID=A0ABW9KH13_9BACT|nr:oligosaccharide flippase family protein [Terriglobus aquaticus]